MTNYDKALSCMRNLFIQDKEAYMKAAMTIIFQDGQDPEEILEDEYITALISRSRNFIHHECFLDTRFTTYDIANALCYIRGEYSLNELRILASDICSDDLFHNIIIGSAEAWRARDDEATSKDIVLGQAMKALDNNVSKLKLLNKPKLNSTTKPKVISFPNKVEE